MCFTSSGRSLKLSGVSSNLYFLSNWMICQISKYAKYAQTHMYIVALLHLLYDHSVPSELGKGQLWLASESGYVSAKGRTALDWF